MFWPPLNRPVYLSTKMSIKSTIKQPKSVFLPPGSPNRQRKFFFAFLRFKIAKFSSENRSLTETGCFPKLDIFIFFIFFFESEFAFIQKNSGLNPWIFQFWGYPRLGPRVKLAPKTGDWIRQRISLSPVYVCISTLARKRCFATFAGVGGGGVRPPPLAFPNEAS